jgi:hypothetical protein
MPKLRRRDGIYWRKDRRKYYLSYVDENGKRRRQPCEVLASRATSPGFLQAPKNCFPHQVDSCWQ